MLGATVMFAVSSALSKWQVAEYSFVEVLFFRAIASFFTCAALILPRTGLAVLHTDTAARSPRPQRNAGSRAKPDHHCVRFHAASRRSGDQFFFALVCNTFRRHLAERESRLGAYLRAYGRLRRGIAGCSAGRRQLPDRCDVCTGQCRPVRKRHRRRTWYDDQRNQRKP